MKEYKVGEEITLVVKEQRNDVEAIVKVASFVMMILVTIQHIMIGRKVSNVEQLTAQMARMLYSLRKESKYGTEFMYSRGFGND